MPTPAKYTDSPIGLWCESHHIYDCADRGPCSPDPDRASCDIGTNTLGRAYCFAHNATHPTATTS